ncbi:arylsulfotransferase family protein [Streptomyces sp. NPDC054796]
MTALTGLTVAGAPPVAAGTDAADATADATAGAPEYVTRPDLTPPDITVKGDSRKSAPGYTLIAPKMDATVGQPPPGGPGGPPSPPEQSPHQGALVADNKGEPVWFLPAKAAHPLEGQNLQRQTYKGKPVLTWYDGEGGDKGSWVIADESYKPIAKVRAGNGITTTDPHEFRITPRGTGLLYANVGVEGEVDGEPSMIIDNVIQEVDIATGKVLWEWRGLDHLDVSESYARPDAEGPGPTFAQDAFAPMADDPMRAYDYLHINSISLDTDGNLLVSGRHTNAVYKIDRKTGEVIWRLGGKKNDFAMGEGAAFAMQHEAERERDGSISVFDNSADRKEGSVSRGLLLDVDTKKMTAKVKGAYPNPDGLVSVTQGSTQLLPNGNVLVNWGDVGAYTEFSRRGKILVDSAFPDEELNTYRAIRADWKGSPDELPAVAGRDAGRGMKVYASWNGATEVAAWKVRAGKDPDHLKPVGLARKKGFETTVPVSKDSEYVAVQALDKKGRVLGTSKAVEVE